MKYYENYNSFNEGKEERNSKNVTKNINKEAVDLKKQKENNIKSFSKDYENIVLSQAKKSINKNTWEETKDKFYDELVKLLTKYKISDLNVMNRNVGNKKNQAHLYFVEKLKKDNAVKKEAEENKKIEQKKDEEAKQKAEVSQKEVKKESDIEEKQKEEKNDTSFNLSDTSKTTLDKIKETKKVKTLSTNLVSKALPSVKLVQEILISKGASIKADGRYGKNTKSNVSKWQSKNGLTSDGIFGSKSWSKLLNIKNLKSSKSSSTSTKSVSNDKKENKTVQTTIVNSHKNGENREGDYPEIKSMVEGLKYNMTPSTNILKIYDENNPDKKVEARYEIENDKIKISDEDKQKIKELELSSEENDVKSDEIIDKVKYSPKKVIEAIINSFGDITSVFDDEKDGVYILKDMLKDNKNYELESISDNGFDNIYGFVNTVFTSTWGNVDEGDWLEIFTNLDKKDLYGFIYNYNNTEHLIDNKKQKINFFDDVENAFNDNEMAKLRKLITKKGIKIDGNKISK